MTDYSKMTTDELDQLSIEMAGLYWGEESGGKILLDSDGIMFGEDWNPTDPNSNQATAYILKALMERYGNDIYWRVTGMFQDIYIGIFERRPWKSEYKSITTAWEWRQKKPAHLDLIYENWNVDYKTINKAIVIASLTTWDYFNNGKA